MFSLYPIINYKKIPIVDITRRMVINNNIKQSVSIFQDYIVKDGENIEDVSFNFYGNSNYAMILLLMNDIIDPFYGWCLSNSELDKLMKDNYGQQNIHNVHHYEKNGDIVSSDVVGAKQVSNYEYELKENEKKRRIKILKPEFLQQFLKEFEDSINE